MPKSREPRENQHENATHFFCTSFRSEKYMIYLDRLSFQRENVFWKTKSVGGILLCALDNNNCHTKQTRSMRKA